MARKLGISVEEVISAAASIADRDGLGNVTLSAVADQLGVRSPSLYAHVDGISGLRRALQLHAAALLTRSVERAVDELSGDRSVRQVAHAYREFAHTHPGLLDALLPAPRPGEDDEVYRALAEPALMVADAIVALGVRPKNAVDAVRSLRSAVHGFVVLEKDGGFGMPENIDDSFDVMVELFISGLGTTYGNELNKPAKDEE